MIRYDTLLMQNAITAHEHIYKYKYNHIQDSKLHTEQYHLYKIYVTEYVVTYLRSGRGVLFLLYKLTKMYLCKESIIYIDILEYYY